MQTGLHDVAEDDLVERRRVDVRALEQGVDGLGAQLRRAERGESALELSDRGPDGPADHDALAHGRTSLG